MPKKRVVVAILGVLVCSALADDNDPKYLSPPIAQDGGVAVVVVRETRERLADAVKEAEHSAKLTVDLKAFIKPLDDNANGVLLYRFLELEDVWDDVGEQLSREAHFNTYDFQRSACSSPIMDEVASDSLSRKDAIVPGFEIGLAGPSRKARAFRLRGKLEVTETKIKTLTVHNLSKVPKNKVTDDELVDVAIEYSLKNGKNSCDITMTSTGRIDRVLNWHLMRNDREWCPQKGSSGGGGNYPVGGEQLEQEYLEHMPDDVDLELDIAVPVKRHVLPFDLKEIELP